MLDFAHGYTSTQLGAKEKESFCCLRRQPPWPHLSYHDLLLVFFLMDICVTMDNRSHV